LLFQYRTYPGFAGLRYAFAGEPYVEAWHVMFAHVSSTTLAVPAAAPAVHVPYVAMFVIVAFVPLSSCVTPDPGVAVWHAVHAAVP
jgi:hypothetical protein